MFFGFPNDLWQEVTTTPTTMCVRPNNNHIHCILSDLNMSCFDRLESAMFTMEKQNSIVTTLPY